MVWGMVGRAGCSWAQALVPLGKSRCPRMEIALRPKGEATAETEEWAAAMRERWGEDRVVVRRADLQLN
jgi:HPt (histidine-containing phosphotransfer) domain-containing protein